MSSKWYPVIDYDKCIECGTCIEKCKNGVYEKNVSRPKVVFPGGCVDGCRGCQRLCPAGAIEYVGDTGNSAGGCGCSCGCSCC